MVFALIFLIPTCQAPAYFTCIVNPWQPPCT